jgi:hypothetical protein
MTTAQQSHGHEHALGHGNSVAAWSAVGIIMAASLVLCFAVVFASVPLAVVGVAGLVLGAVVGKVLTAAGFGSHARNTR